ncbi:MAG: DUF3667 domain-containing protein [Xanthomonadales bacterium]|nr:DUF3667 domain-containing protein [Xanthomonadales bacterium]NIX12266.1 DUF3667 domain-containing protein [Xanthomonadales bacterium]
MSENESTTGIAVADDPAGDFIAADKSLTMRPERLAGSPACLNCGTGLRGPFCYYCGQPDRNFLRFFPALLREFMEDFLELDSRFVRTMKPLLFKPGRLTRDYLEGRRFRYTPPMRLYLISSIAFFVIAAMLSTNAIRVGSNEKGAGSEAPVVRFSFNDGGLQAHLEEAGVADSEAIIEAINRELAAMDQTEGEGKVKDGNIGEDGDEDLGEDGTSQKESFTTDQIQFNDRPWDRETNPVRIRWLPQFVNDWINDEIEESPEKARGIEENPRLIVEQIFDILPATMFVLLPVVALLFKFWYLFAKRYYIEHLIFALHNHSFVFVSLTLMLLLGIVGGMMGESGLAAGRTATNVLIAVMGVWVPLYMLISLRHVYRQNWFLTVLKFGLIGLSYVTLLGLVTSVVAILGFVLL